jgi:hypothetical protein
MSYRLCLGPLFLTWPLQPHTSCSFRGKAAFHWSTAFEVSTSITDGPVMLQQNLSLS